MAGHVPLLNSKATSMSLTLPSTSVQAEVIGERINQVGGYGLEIPALYHFYGHESNSGFVSLLWPRKWYKLAQVQARDDLQKYRKVHKTLP